MPPPSSDPEQAQQQLADATRRLEAALQASQVTVFEQDVALRYTWIHNPVHGFDSAQVVGKRDGDLMERAEDARRTEALKRSVIETGVGQRSEVLVHHDGQRRWYDLSMQPKRGLDGSVVGVTCTAVDITERRLRMSHLTLTSRLDLAFDRTATVGQIARETAVQVAEHLELSHCVLVEIDEEEGVAHLFEDAHRPEAKSLVGAYSLDEYLTAHERAEMRAGRQLVIEDVAAPPRSADATARFRRLEIGALVNSPHFTGGRRTFVLGAMRAAPAAWSVEDRRLLQDVASRTFLRIERRRAEDRLAAARDTFECLVRNSPFGIYVVDADFTLALVSAGAQKVFSTVHPLIGRDFAEVLRSIWPEPFASDAIDQFRATLATGKTYHAPSTVERRHDIGVVEAYDWKIERITMPDGRHAAVCHFYDLSERQRHEAALQEIDRQRTDFIAMLAHELRNPLAPIRTAVTILRRTPDDEMQARCRDIIGRQVDQMARLLDDLMDVARLTRASFTLQARPTLLSQVIDAAVETTQPLLEHDGLRLIVRNEAPDLVLDIDGARITQVLANLLNNAAKYVAPRSEIEVSVSLASSPLGAGGRWVRIAVKDSGIGMSPQLLVQVFDLYLRGGTSHDKVPGGLGIGLALARHLVQLHGGRIEAHSDGEGQGSTFTVWLPVPPPRAQTPAAGGRPESSAGAGVDARRRIIVVDDSADAADTAAFLLSGSGSEAHAAYDGARALALGERIRPHAVVIDLNMPGMDGYELCRRIRQQPWSEGCLLIALSGWAQPEDRRRSREAGFVLHLVKPVQPDELVRAVAGLEGEARP